MIDLVTKLIGMFAGLIGTVILKSFGLLFIGLFIFMMLIGWILSKYIEYRRRSEP